jgi:hypothetical protein
LEEATSDITSITRAREISVVDKLYGGQIVILENETVQVAIAE